MDLSESQSEIKKNKKLTPFSIASSHLISSESLNTTEKIMKEINLSNSNMFCDYQNDSERVLNIELDHLTQKTNEIKRSLVTLQKELDEKSQQNAHLDKRLEILEKQFEKVKPATKNLKSRVENVEFVAKDCEKIAIYFKNTFENFSHFDYINEKLSLKLSKIEDTVSLITKKSPKFTSSSPKSSTQNLRLSLFKKPFKN